MAGRRAGAGRDRGAAGLVKRRRGRGPDKTKRKRPSRSGEPLAASTLKRGNGHRIVNGTQGDYPFAQGVEVEPAVTPVSTTNEERARLALREVQRKLSKNEAPTRLVTLPGVQPFSAMTRFVDGGRAKVIETLQMAVLNNDPTACQWWEVYRELPNYPRSIISFDDVCAASGVSPQQLIVVLVSTEMTFGRDVGNYVAAAMHPKVISKLVESAARIDGDYADLALKDRHAFLQAKGFLPTPKGATINVHASASAQAASAAAQEPSVPSFTETIDATAERRVGAESIVTPIPERLALPAPAANPLDALHHAHVKEPVRVRS